MSLVSGISYLLFTIAIDKLSPKKIYPQKAISEEKKFEVSLSFFFFDFEVISLIFRQIYI